MFEGPYTKLGAIAGVLAVVVAIMALILDLPSATGWSPPKAISTSPAPSPGSPGSSASPVEPTEPASPVMTTYIEDLPYTADSDPYDNRDVAHINGQSYAHSQAAQFCFGSHERKWGYTLERGYTRLRATVGLSDNSAARTVVNFEILADGHSVFAKEMQRGQAATIDLPVQNILTVTLVSTLLSDEGSCGRATAEWGEVRVERS
jgi:NPCBM/NEW2 domain